MGYDAGYIELDDEQWSELDRHLTLGLAAFAVASPMSLEEWAREHFYLSTESSYVEQDWTPWPPQRAILAAFGHDDIVEIDVRKSARVGFTKMLLAAIAYFAEHKRRNQAIWQPTDEDADDFVKSELDTMLRDVEVMRNILPTYLARHRDNTLRQKRFIGSMLRVRGAKAAKNFRRFSADCAYIDELDGCDNDVEKEGDPATLALKRIEGATFPKFICGSTPKQRGFSQIDERCARAEHRFTFQIACPHCAKRHAITWGGKDEPHGFKWTDNDPASVMHLCPHCSCLTTQADYLVAWERGLWINEDGSVVMHDDATFSDGGGNPLPRPRHIAVDIWSAYSPMVSWVQIVDDFLAAFRKMQEGDDTKMKAWTNTTLGRSWEGEIERTEADELKNRAEPFKLRYLVRDCLLLLAGLDTQDNRIEAGVWGLGIGGEMWTVDHQIFFGNPALQPLWDEVEAFLRETHYPHACGVPQRIYASAIDSGGHHADAVYAFAHRLRGLRVHAIKGAAQRERSIDNGNTRVDYSWNGKIEKHGPILWHVGTNLAKDRFQSRLAVASPGPGYVHLSKDLSDEWFAQLAGEVRATRRTNIGSETRWTQIRARIEVRDCLAYSIWLEERLGLWHPRKAAWWKQLIAAVQPEGDLFSLPVAEQSDGMNKIIQVQNVPHGTSRVPLARGVRSSGI